MVQLRSGAGRVGNLSQLSAPVVGQGACGDVSGSMMSGASARSLGRPGMFGNSACL